MISDAKVFVYVENGLGHSEFLSTLELSKYKEATRVALTLNSMAQVKDARICWTQKKHAGENLDGWMLDEVMLLTEDIERVDDKAYIQYSLNMHCDRPASNISIVVEYSTDHSVSWHPILQHCVPSMCQHDVENIRYVNQAKKL